MLLLAASFVFGVIGVFGASSSDVAIRELGDHWTEGVVIVDRPPAEVYAAATDYANWHQLFTDVSDVTIESGGPRDARVRFTSKAFDNTVTVKFDNEPNRAIRFTGVKGPPGSVAKGEYIFEPVDGGKRTRITARLYLDVKGVASWIVRENRIRPLRQAKLRADLSDGARWGARHAPAV
jgi:hypothetical protein